MGRRREKKLTVNSTGLAERERYGGECFGVLDFTHGEQTEISFNFTAISSAENCLFLIAKILLFSLLVFFFLGAIATFDEFVTRIIFFSYALMNLSHVSPVPREHSEFNYGIFSVLSV